MITLSNNPYLCINPGVAYILLAFSDLMYRLAPWIMLLVALWGIGRLFRRDRDDKISDADNERDWYRQQDNDDVDEEFDDDFEEE